MSSSQAAPAYLYIPPTLQHLSIGLDTFLHQNPYVHRLAVGGLILHPNSSTANSPRLLLLQRANSRRAPRSWELPGGSCVATDEKILHSLVRHVFEDTGMRVTTIVAQVGEVEYLTSRGLNWAKMCFLVGVEEVTGREETVHVPVRIQRAEHRGFRWTSAENVETVEVTTEAQRDFMRRGFGAFEEWCNGVNMGAEERLLLLYL